MNTKIWTLPTRIFHWLLALGFTAAYLLGDADQWMNYHYAAGLFVGTLLIFRIIFGIIGPAYSRFSDFSVGRILKFPSEYFSKDKYYAGHNPFSSLVFLAIFLTGITCSLTGYLQYAGPDNIFGLPSVGEDFEEVHEAFANIFLGLVILHLAGLLSDAIFHGKYRTITSMFTGRKNIDAVNARLNTWQKLFAGFWIIVPFIVFYLSKDLPVRQEQEKEEHHLEQIDDDDDDDDD